MPCPPKKPESVVGPSEWASTVAELAGRGVALEDMLGLYALLFEQMRPFDPQRSTTRDVVHEAVIPITREGMCSYAELTNAGSQTTPQWFTTHHWDNVFSFSMAAMVAAVLELPTYEAIAHQLAGRWSRRRLMNKLRRRGQAGQAFWFCGLSVNQHKTICSQGLDKNSITEKPYPLCSCSLAKVTSGDGSEINKFKDLLAHLNRRSGLQQVMALDPDFQLFTRAWCVAELVEASQQKMGQALKLHSSHLTYGHRQQLSELDVRRCEARDPRDLHMILAGIPDPEAFNSQLRALLLDEKTGLLQAWQQLQDYFRQWDGFSPELVEQLVAPTAGKTWRCLAFLVLPVAVSLPFFSAFPLPAPGDPRAAYMTALAQWCPATLLGSMCLLVFLRCTLKLQWSQFKPLFVGLFLLAVTVLGPLITLVWWILLDLWPLPWAMVLSTPVLPLCLPLLWLCIPPEVRSQPATRRRCLIGVLLTGVMVTLWMDSGPVTAGLMSWVSDPWLRSLLAAGLLGQKLAFEWVLHLAAKHLTADVMPLFIWYGAANYEFLLCVAVTRAGRFDLFALLIGFDVLENCFHLWSLARQRARPQPTTGEHKAAALGREHFILSQLLLREFAELMSPAVFLASLLGLNFGAQRNHNDLVCSWRPAEFWRACELVLLDLAVELAMALAAWLLLRRLGCQPWQTLRGLVVHLDFFGLLVLQTAVIWQRLNEQSTGAGADYSFQFSWREAGAEWACGLKWTGP